MDQGSRNNKTANSATEPGSQQDYFVKAPSISLPKGGGAIRGMGEKFTANPVTGTGSMLVPIATSPGRSGFGPQLSISYDSGAGNGPFGLGWNLSIPSITRKTDKGLPKYQDSEEFDVFILSGAEDLVPLLIDKGEGEWELEKLKPRTVNNNTYSIKGYRPRIEGLFARIERWTNQDPEHPEDTFWRSISKDNITTWYGRTEESRIFDPTNKARIFSWLICESYHDKGNAIVYRYVSENSDNVDLTQANERNRGKKDDKLRSANRYLKRIRYGNQNPFLPDLSTDDPWSILSDAEDVEKKNNWFFEVVFDYGEHDQDKPLPVEASKQWPVRNDPFSSYRAGFEVRSYRLCQRVLMFHNFPDEEVGDNCLVRSMDFTYSYETNPKDAQNPIFSYLLSVTQTGYQGTSTDGYHSKSLPPLEFGYSPVLTREQLQQQPIRTIDNESLENLPYGMDGSNYQWVDLDGEGISGILTEQADGWFYKRNISAIQQSIDPITNKEYTAAHFSSLERVVKQPNKTLTGGQAQFLDLAGDGQTDLVVMEGSPRGFYERTQDEDWENFQTFPQWPNIDTRDPNLKFIDLTGDGQADILISEDQAFVWHASLAEAGFTPAQRVQQVFDEEKGPRLVFADGTQSIYLADFSGDGLTDLVRIRNGEVCYWPNLGYCRFGQKVSMDNAPLFDHTDQFDQRRIRLADIDGSGVTDILYLHRDGVRTYYNQSGNSWSMPLLIANVPATDNVKSVTVVDLLGNGTACLVWSSPLPGDARMPMHYLDLMAGQKPHLLVSTNNNLGSETQIDYAPSTKFYLRDKLAGKPWITKLPFPVHCVEKVTVTDKWRKASFSNTYSYHHGYFDGVEREFRGFGRVEQVDVESYGQSSEGNAASPYITDDLTLYQPPVKTVTWYHTGVYLNRQTILSHFEHEYFPNWLKAKQPELKFNFQEHQLPEPDLQNEDLSADEWREALRACKGMMLRQEIYELDVDALEKGKQQPVKLFSTAFHNCRIKRLQPRQENHHAVFLATESESLTYHYELDLCTPDLSADPRIAHTLILRENEYGQPQQTIAIAYGRQKDGIDNYLESLPDKLKSDKQSLIQTVQSELHIAYTEICYTEDYIFKATATVTHCHRLPVPCETRTYELKGVPKPQNTGFYSQADFQSLSLSDIPAYNPSPLPSDVKKIAVTKQYHEYADGKNSETGEVELQKRLVEHARSLFWKDDFSGHLPFTKQGTRSLKYQDYKLAMTDELLASVFGTKLDDKVVTEATIQAVREKLKDYKTSGYALGSEIDPSLSNLYWIRSGIAGFADDAAQHFYLPERYTDPFDNTTTLKYDDRDLFIQSSTDQLGNTIQIATNPETQKPRFDYRVLAPIEMVDVNANRTEVCFDVLGMVIALAVKGKGDEADDLTGFDRQLANPSIADVQKFCTKDDLDLNQARTWLNHATSRFVYHFGEQRDDQGKVIQWADRPAGACSIVREIHYNALGGADSPLQVSLECCDGGGNVLMKKIQAEPNPKLSVEQQKLRWIINGLTILNNKGKPVKQYEPYFSEQGFGCEPPSAKGVTPIIYYDATGRTIRTEMPDGSYSRVEFSPWHTKTFDANDTAFDPAEKIAKHSDWYQRRTNATHLRYDEFNTPENLRAAELVKAHANTPAITILDSLGRDVIAIAHNRIEIPSDTNTPKVKKYRDEYYLTYTKLDAEGKPLWIRDALGHLVMQYITPPKPTRLADDNDEDLPHTVDPITNKKIYSVPCYDIAGNLLFQHSMDAGDRWMLNDAAGKPMFAWDSNERAQADGSLIAENRLYHTVYDALHRPLENWLTVQNGEAALLEAFEYTDTNTVPDLNAAQHLNLIGQAIKHYDASGLMTTDKIDFKGAVEQVSRTLVKAYKESVIDWNTARADKLEPDTFRQITQHDALGRIVTQYNWHRDITFASNNQQTATPGFTNRVAVYVPQYNERGLLKAETLHVRASKTQTGGDISFTPDPDPSQKLNSQAIKAITYNAKGQKLTMTLGNGTKTTYTYDEETFRVTRIKTQGDPAQQGYQDLSYTYDPVGNITHINDIAQPVIFKNNTEIKPEHDYTYDALYRLIEATGRENATTDTSPPACEGTWPKGVFPSPDNPRNYTQRYQYDAVGNFTDMCHQPSSGNGWTRRYQYAFDDPAQPASNRLWRTWEGAKAWADGTATNKVTYRYDSHGNMLNLANVLPGQQLRWDWRDMIGSLDLVGGGWAYYQYDAGKQRTHKVIEKQGGSKHWERIYLGGLELYRRYDSNGELKEEIETLHLMEGDGRVLLVEDVRLTEKDEMLDLVLFRYQYGNHLGSVALELDEAAQIISYEEYHPYGTTAYRLMNKDSKASDKRYRYTGKERDGESGLYYFGARYYASWLGRWCSSDPRYLVDDLNIYIFTKNNSINFKDFIGYQAEKNGKESSIESRVEMIKNLLEKGYIAEQIDEYFNAQQVCLNYENYCREHKLSNPKKLENKIAEAKAKYKYFSKYAQENMDQYLDTTGTEKIMPAQIFDKSPKVIEALKTKWRNKFIKGVEDRLKDGRLNPESAETQLEMNFIGSLEAYSSNPKDNLGFSVGGFQLKATVKALVKKIGPNSYKVDFLDWENQIFDLYNWDPGKVAAEVKILKETLGLPSDKEMCCVENAGKGKAYLIRTEPWKTTDKDVLKSFEVKIYPPETTEATRKASP